jgi:DNA-binding GntR family transcriptional regulator
VGAGENHRAWTVDLRNTIETRIVHMTLKAGRAGRDGSPTDRVYRALLDAITEQGLSPGARLPEDTIGAHFGVSRTIARAALNRLHADRVVELHRNRGAAVARPSIEESRQVFQARRCIEREIVASLARAITRPQIALLEGHVRREDAGRLEAGERHSIRLSGEFHLLMADIAGNGVLHAFLGELVSRTSLILALYGRPQPADCSAGEHRQIIAALKEGSVAAATAALETHLRAVEERTDLSPPEPARADLRAVLQRYAPRASR